MCRSVSSACVHWITATVWESLIRFEQDTFLCYCTANHPSGSYTGIACAMVHVRVTTILRCYTYTVFKFGLVSGVIRLVHLLQRSTFVINLAYEKCRSGETVVVAHAVLICMCLNGLIGVQDEGAAETAESEGRPRRRTAKARRASAPAPAARSGEAHFRVRVVGPTKSDSILFSAEGNKAAS